MSVVPKKTVRFTELVKEVGRPEQVTLWTPPQKDPAFWKAVQQHRVVTVIQRNIGSKKDYGLVGFFQQPLATFLVFDKKITHPDETKVVGIKYDQLRESPPRGGVFKPSFERPPGL